MVRKSRAGHDLVVCVFFASDHASSQLPLQAVGQFALICSTIAVPRNRALLSADHAQYAPLKPREVEVLRATNTGATSREVAAQIGLTARTVDSYIQSAMAKLNCTTKVMAILRAMRLGYL